MSVIECFQCSESFGTPSAVRSHIWDAHLSSTSWQEQKCRGCDGVLTEENSSYHYPCFYDVRADELGIFHELGMFSCPLCGEICEMDSVESHLLTHSFSERRALLTNQQNCYVCGDPVNSVEQHISCVYSNIDLSSGSPDTSVTCPSTECEVQSPPERLYLHIWDSHIESRNGTATCPGCSDKITLGELGEHLVCFDSLDHTVSRILPGLDRTCFICGTTVYDRSVLHRHFYQKHLSQTSQCPGCGERLTEDENADIVDHIVCLAQSRNDAPLDAAETCWPCPVCEETHSGKNDFASHFEQSHLDRLLTSTNCAVCGDSIVGDDHHTDCIVSTGPEVTESSSTRFAPEAPVDSSAYFSELYEFIDRERAAERAQNREQYENNTIEQLANQNAAIPELVYIGERYHPRFDTQLVYERPVPEEKTDQSLQDLMNEYGIYPREIVLVGCDQHDNNLPLPGTVGFIDEQTIGIGFPEVDGGIDTAPLQDLTRSNRTYHAARLINPAPFDAEEDAVDTVRADSTLSDLVLGKKPLTGSRLRFPSKAAGKLNEYQTNAVERALGSEDVVCIHGPPGTGKTRTLRRLIRLATSQGQRVLATSHSNQAIDNLLVGTSTPVEPDPNSLHYVGSPAGRERFLPKQLRDRLDDDEEDEAAREQATEFLNRPAELSIARVGNNSSNDIITSQYADRSVDDADLVAGTMGALGSIDNDLPDFDLVVVDEAGQAAQPPTFIPAQYGETLVLAGDHLQLPPYAADEEAKEEQMHTSLFEHLINVYGDDVTELLRRQYRMNEQIAAFPNEQIYGGKIETANRNRGWHVDDLKPLVGVDVSGNEETPPGSQSTRNPREAEVAANHVKLLKMSGLEASDIGVITPYTAQIKEIRSAVQSELGPQRGLKIDTVDSFQGSEREAIIVSWVRSNRNNNSGFLAFPEEGKRRLNVAMTRAKKRLVMIGDWNTLGTPSRSENPEDTCSTLFSDFYQLLNENNLIKQL